jgi:hypothetical protein
VRVKNGLQVEVNSLHHRAKKSGLSFTGTGKRSDLRSLFGQKIIGYLEPHTNAP